MHFSSIVATTALFAGAFAVDHSVMVGGRNGELTFTPNSLNASKGDNVIFHYWPKNHSVAQATFAKPCEPMDNGFWSGYVPSNSGAASDTFMMTVTDATKPIWFYCTQAKHCQSGMVGAINAPTAATGNTLQKFSDAAKAAANNVAPSSKAGTGGMIMSNSSSSQTTPSASGATPAQKTGAASALEVSQGLAYSGLFAMLGYLFF